MRNLKHLFDFYIDASIHVALAVYSLLWVSSCFFDIAVDNYLGGFVFFGTIACYNFMKYGVEAHKYILVASRYHKNIQFFSLLCLGIALYFAFFLHVEVLLVLGVLSLLIGLYTLPVLPGTKNLRSFGGFKIFLVALVWAGTTVLLPVLMVDMNISCDVIIEIMQRFILVLILLVPFEIRDLKFDAPELNTLPQRYGVTRTKIFGAFATLPFFFLTLFKDDISQLEAVSRGVMFLALGSMIFITRRNQSKYFASFWVEGIPIFWAILLWGLSKVL
ncbi:hypothetical protein [uncultured Kriegella sp.]|uniref:hypothetical protein n=1 Tax=uncultured Kriegella sp. TaxID=1798910 RepID=UPI0030DA4561|tara:strand:- start:40328 stop:41152 length:825 start_codon:yes stop_codon:yes gene_type:complete